MTQVAIAAMGALAVIVPALLSIPYGPRRRVAAMHEKIRALADLDGLTGDGASDLKADLRSEIRSDLRRMEMQRQYGSLIPLSLFGLSGFAMLTIGVSLLLGRNKPKEALETLTDFGVNLLVAWGSLIFLATLARLLSSARRVRADQKKFRSKLTEAKAALDVSSQRLEVLNQRQARFQEVADEIKSLEHEVQLHQAMQTLEELREQVKQLKAQETKSIESPDDSA
jgi:hypothetical protein